MVRRLLKGRGMKTIPSASFVVGALALALAACTVQLQEGDVGAGGASGSGGSGSGSGSDPSGQADPGLGAGGSAAASDADIQASCKTLCEKVKPLACSKAPADCESSCAASIKEPAGCSGLHEDLVACQGSKGTLACTATGEVQATGCEAEADKLDACTACEPNAKDTACESCVRGSCCTEVTAFFAAKDYDAYVGCIDACNGTESCETACDGKYPTAAAANDKVSACGMTSCKDACGSGQ